MISNVEDTLLVKCGRGENMNDVGNSGTIPFGISTVNRKDV